MSHSEQPPALSRRALRCVAARGRWAATLSPGLAGETATGCPHVQLDVNFHKDADPGGWMGRLGLEVVDPESFHSRWPQTWASTAQGQASVCRGSPRATAELRGTARGQAHMGAQDAAPS